MASDTALAIFFQPPRPRGVRPERDFNLQHGLDLSTPAPAGSETLDGLRHRLGDLLSTPAPAGSETRT